MIRCVRRLAPGQWSLIPLDRQARLMHPIGCEMSLTTDQRELVGRRLREERARALRALNRSVAESSGATEQDRTGDLTAVPFHPADLGTDTMQAEFDAANATRTSQELAEID